ncbi:hypothetical protein ABZV91_17785 [Nocardia sp. NPDC004568]|uniref:hypothetical protein n=1 Tax=Nocardia sp. NPDC004568 TaxID=3154551 RepID=UPI0033B847F8
MNGPEDALRHALRALAERWQYLDSEAKEPTKMIGDLVRRAAPQLLEPLLPPAEYEVAYYAQQTPRHPALV